MCTDKICCSDEPSALRLAFTCLHRLTALHHSQRFNLAECCYTKVLFIFPCIPSGASVLGTHAATYICAWQSGYNIHMRTQREGTLFERMDAWCEKLVSGRLQQPGQCLLLFGRDLIMEHRTWSICHNTPEIIQQHIVHTGTQIVRLPGSHAVHIRCSNCRLHKHDLVVNTVKLPRAWRVMKRV